MVSERSFLLFCVVALIANYVQAHIEIAHERNNETAPRRFRKRQAQGACTYEYKFQNPGDSAFLSSPNYPGDYPPNVDCRYFITSPVGTRLTMECSEFNVESSLNCQYDVFFLSLTGNRLFSDQEYHCGAGTLVRTTRANQLAIGFHSDGSNPQVANKFLFRCKLTVSGTPPTATPTQPPCSCGIRNEGPSTRIVGGTTASVGEFPWRCSLYSVKAGVFCACTIISANWVLAAAHCTRNVEKGDQIFVNVGDHDLSSNTDTRNELVPVSTVIENSQYNDQNQDADISLLRLSKTLTFSRNVSPVCLPWKFPPTDLNGENVVASGWGTQYFAGPTSSTLQKVDLQVLGLPQCKQSYQRQRADFPTANMLCTFTRGRDTCQGDSGGSIDYNSGGRYYAVGVVSQGDGCGSELPGVYTKVASYLNWIQINTGETFCKV